MFQREEAQNSRSTNRVAIGARAQEALDVIKQERAKSAEKRNKMSSFQPDGTNVNVAAEINRRIGEYSRTAGLTLGWLLEVAKRAVSADFRGDDR
jgi:hypothetical protein